MTLIENDVRLMRRMLIALRCKLPEDAQRIIDYLRDDRKLDFVLPDEQTEKQREGYLVRLQVNEKWLARKYGCVLLPDYYDCIFLNSKWANPYTMYVHLTTPVEELGELGEVYWLPEGQRKNWEDYAEKNHAAYLKATAIPVKPKSWWKNLLDELANILR